MRPYGVMTTHHKGRTMQSNAEMKAEYDAHVKDIAVRVMERMKMRDPSEWRNAVDTEVHDCTDQDEWVTNQDKAIQTLTYSDSPCAGIVNGTGPCSKDVGNDSSATFPFAQFAANALQADVYEVVIGMLDDDGIDLMSDEYDAEE